jgi:SAM-dependent methyltransferase
MEFGTSSNILDQMRGEWNGRAKKDANFYVAFGRQDQAEEDFLASAAEVLPAFEQELVRLPAVPTAGRRALEIGCGPGRLMIPMTRYFGEVHGVDISEEMISLARTRLRDVPNASVHVTSGADLTIFADGYFDFVYSYIVFQHIPDRNIVLNYLREAQRVLKPGGVLCCQIRGIAPVASEIGRESETWTGCFFNAEEIAQFAREEAFPLVALSGLDTQYMWTTFRKPFPDSPAYTPERIVVKDITSAGGPGSCIPTRGRGAAVSLWIDGMPDSASLADFTVMFGERRQLGCYLSPISESGGCQFNARLPEGTPPGEYQVQLRLGDDPLHDVHLIEVIASSPAVPRLISVTDGINHTSRCRVETGGAKVAIEDVSNPAEVSFNVGGLPVEYCQYECIDPITSGYAFTFHLNHRTPSGTSRLSVWVAGHEVAFVDIEVVR